MFSKLLSHFKHVKSLYLLYPSGHTLLHFPSENSEVDHVSKWYSHSLRVWYILLLQYPTSWQSFALVGGLHFLPLLSYACLRRMQSYSVTGLHLPFSSCSPCSSQSEITAARHVPSLSYIGLEGSTVSQSVSLDTATQFPFSSMGNARSMRMQSSWDLGARTVSFRCVVCGRGQARAFVCRCETRV